MRALFKDIGTLLNLAWPVVISRVGFLTLAIVDTIMVGQYASSHLAYLGIGLIPSNIIIVILLGLLLGTSVLVSRHYGAGEYAKTGEVWLMSLPWAFLLGLVGLVFCAFGEEILLLSGQSAELAEQGGAVSLIAGLSIPMATIYLNTSFFLEAVRRPRPVMVIMIVANVVNIIANYVLVYGLYGFPELGALGAIWASFIIRTVQMVLLLAYVFLLFDFRAYGISWQAAKHQLKRWTTTRDYRHIGYATGISIGVENLSFNILGLFAGLLGIMVVAAHTIVINVYILFYMAGLGLSVATSVSVGNAYGAGDMRMVRRWAWLGVVMIVLVSAPFVAVVYLLAPDIVAFFSKDAPMLALAAAMLAYSAGALVFDAAQSCLSMCLRARGDNWMPSYIHSFIYIVLMLPISYVLMFPLGRGALGVIDAVYIGTVLPFVAMAWRYYSLDKHQRRGAISPPHTAQ